MPVNAPYSSSMDKEIQKAANIINSFFKNSTVDADSSIPAELIKNCAGLAFLTVVKAGMIWTGKVGTGIVIARLEDGSWSAPSGIGTAGIGFGAEIGGEIVDFMLVLGSKSALKTFKKGTQVSVGAGLELAVGPMGRAAGASINAGGGGVGANYTYSRAKGAFAGVGLHGSTIMVRGEMNAKFYGKDTSPMEILNGHIQAPAGSCDRLYEAIQMAEGKQGVSIYPSTDPRSAHYSGNTNATRSNSFENRSSFNGSFNNNNSSSISAASTASTSRASMSTPSTTQPASGDPRLHRYSTYKSEKELYEQYAKTKSPSTATTSATAPSSGGGAGAGYGTPAPMGYAAPAAAGYGSAYAAAPAPQPAYNTVPVTNYGPNYHAQAAAPSPYGAYGYGGASAPVQQHQPAPPPPARPTVKTVPVTNYVPNYGAAPAPTPKPPVPSPAVGAETKQVYTQVISFVQMRCPHANVQVFKDNCRLFGQDQMSLDAYLAYLTSICTTHLLKELVPQLVRLLPTQEKRDGLWMLYVREVLMIR